MAWSAKAREAAAAARRAKGKSTSKKLIPLKHLKPGTKILVQSGHGKSARISARKVSSVYAGRKSGEVNFNTSRNSSMIWETGPKKKFIPGTTANLARAKRMLASRAA